MCLAIPGQIVAVRADAGTPVAEVEYGGVRRTALLLYLPDAAVGDWVVVQAGFAIRRLSAQEAREALDLAEEGASLLAGSSPLPPSAAVRATERL